MTPYGLSVDESEKCARCRGIACLNHRPQPVEVEIEGENLLDGEALTGAVTLDPYGVLVVKQTK